MRKISLLLFLALPAFLYWSCDKGPLTDPSARLEFSTDTLTFDTVFTTMGSATRKFKVYNRHDAPIILSRVWLEGGATSQFRFNVDGTGGTEIRDVEILPNDSIWVFAFANINPTQVNQPFLLYDKLNFEVNSNVQQVTLEAWGQDAYYVLGNRSANLTAHFTNDTTLATDKPWIFVGYVVATNPTRNIKITIPAGAQIHMFGGPTGRPGDRATLIIYDNATLEVLGTESNPVVFKTHRLEDAADSEVSSFPDFQNLPSQHNGIWFFGRTYNNKIRHAIIRNGVYGIWADTLSVNNRPKVDIRNTIIHNVGEAGILATNSQIYAENCLVYNTSKYGVLLIKGGQHEFNHCSFLNYATSVYIRRKNEPIIGWRDYIIKTRTNGDRYVEAANGFARFRNCIIHGIRNEEIMVDKAVGSTTNFGWSFDHCVIKRDTFNSNLNNCIINPLSRDTLFVDAQKNNYQLHPLSPAIDRGVSGINDYLGIPLVNDLLLNPRNGIPDIGAYER